MLQFNQGIAFMKAALPYVHPAARERLSLLIQAGDLADSMEQAADMPLSACGFQSASMDIEGLLTAFLPLCGFRDRRFIEQMLRWIRIRKFLFLYQNIASSGDNDPAGIMDILMQQLSPEQRETFENYQAMFEAMNL